ncbi:VCBS repeat-containing protein, partial [candidate division KSB1 bacterium]|nr:VCBS repeat-containing protein [candidate division KSB1 bacterium]
MRPVLTNRNLFLSISLFFLTSNLVSQAPVSFREVAAIYGVAGEGLSYGHSSALMDFNNDDLLDIGFTVKTARNFLFINRGNGHFDEIATAAGLNKRTDQRIRGMSVADYDNDGDLDVYLTAGRASQFYRNNGDLTFTDVTKAAGVEDFGNGLIASWGDYNRDGFIDLYVSNWDDSRHALFKNKGDGTFKNVTQEAGLGNDANNHVGLWLDFDNDGDLDMFVSRAFYKLFRLWRNNGDGTFTNIAGRAGLECDVFGQGSTTADYDNDGFLDIYVASCYERNILFHNNGDGTFTNIAGQAGVDGSGRSVDCVSGDFNNDGWMDIYVGNYDWNPGDPDYGGNPEGYNRLYWNNGNETFTNDPGITADRSRTIGSSIGDLNNDGFDDLYTVNSSTLNKLYENKGNSNNWLQIQLQGVKSSRDAIGTRIELEINGKKRIKEISGASGYCSHSSLIQTFGLGSANNVDRITIKWISGTVDELNNITVNQRLKLKEGQVWSSVDSLFFIDVNSAVLTPNEAKISWQTNKTARGFVRYGLTEDLLNTTDSTIVPGFLSAITLENLTADTTYYFLVSAMDTTGDGIESEMMSFVTTLIPVLAENIAAQALLTASSENEKWKQTVDKAVDGFVDGYPGDYTKEWVATTDPVGTWFNLEFEDGRVIDKIILHDRINFSDQILEMQLTFDSGDRIMTGPLPNDGAPLVIEFTPKTIKNIRLEVTKAQGSSVGLAEVEVWQAANSVNQPRLEIEQVNVTDIDSNSAVIHWRTSIECTGECYVNDDTLTTTLSNSHTVFVENLLPGTTYPFLIFVASTEGETAQSEVLSFTTMEASVPSDTIPADTTSTPQELFDITGNGLVTASSEKV